MMSKHLNILMSTSSFNKDIITLNTELKIRLYLTKDKNSEKTPKSFDLRHCILP